MKKIPAKSRKLSWKDIRLITQALIAIPWEIKAAIKSVTLEYRLGPKGAWILRMIETGDVNYPLDVSRFFRDSQSVTTDALARLTEANLITYCKSNDDRRQIKLALTPLGTEVSSRIWEEVESLITERFKSYSRDEMLKFTRMLQGFVNAEDMSLRAQTKDGPPVKGPRTPTNSLSRERRSRAS